jgi:phage portal protein BeeE
MKFFRRRGEQRTLGWWPTWGTTPGELAPQSALGIADVWACVRVLADSAASVPLIAYRRRESGRERLSTGRLAGLLERPAPATTQANLVSQAVAHLTLYGNAYLGKFRDGDGRLGVEVDRGEAVGAHRDGAE